MAASTTCQEQISAAMWSDLRDEALHQGVCLAGFHNHNYLLEQDTSHPALDELGVSGPVKVRVGRQGALKVVERPWPDEGAVLRALCATRSIPHLPHFVAASGEVAVHEYVPGVTLATVCPPGKPVDTVHVEAIIDQLACFARVPVDALPQLPADWAADGDSQAFLRARADFAEQQVRAANWPDMAGLFAALEVPATALSALRDRIPRLHRRPFVLLHGDLHRHNIIVRADGRGLTLVDWELAMWGDPLHDLAIHVVRMRYPADQRWEVVERWRAAVPREVSAGLRQDLPVYIGYERAQSLYADTIRAVRGLGPHPGARAVDAAVSRVRNALHLAAGPLRLTRVPSRTEVERALLSWARSPRAGRADA